MYSSDKTHVLVLTGAGISAESGIPTFRDSNGLWENHPIEEVASPQAFAKDPQKVWRFYSQRREAAFKATPNKAHYALVELEKRLGHRFLLVSQNVDDLHKRAGAKNLINLHGNLFRSRCTRCSNSYPDMAPRTMVPLCKGCGAQVRPDIVWFGETIEEGCMNRIFEFLRQSRGGKLRFIAIGTSGVVQPAASLARLIGFMGGKNYLINAEVSANGDDFHFFQKGLAGEVLPKFIEGMEL